MILAEILNEKKKEEKKRLHYLLGRYLKQSSNVHGDGGVGAGAGSWDKYTKHHFNPERSRFHAKMQIFLRYFPRFSSICKRDEIM